MESNERTGVSRRHLLRLGLFAAASVAGGAILSACGDGAATSAPPAAAATTAPTTGAAAVATTAPTAVATTGGAATTAATPAATTGGAATTAPAAMAAAMPTTAPAMVTAAGGMPTATVAPTPKTAKNANAVKLTWWHAMGGALGTALSDLVNQYNDSQSDIFVQDVFQGSYDDILTKFRNSLMQPNNLPNVMQVYDIGVRFIVDSKAMEPMQTFIDRDKFDLSQFEPALLNYFTVEKVQYGMPFNNSNPILYYNKTAFKDAGLNPDMAPRTWDDVSMAAAKLTKKDAAGKTTQYGVAIAIYSWLFEQWHAAQGQLLATPDNGRSARATQLVYNGDAGVKVLEWWKGMIDAGTAANLGRNTSDTQKAFVAGQVPMTLDSTAALRGIVSGVGTKFDLGTAYLPRPSANVSGGGVIIGGASNYILKAKADPEKQAAWKFIQWLSQPKQQAFWHINTGYFPVRKDAYDLPEVKMNFEKYPQFRTAVTQLQESPINPATSGAVFGVFLQARQDIEGAIEEVILGRATPKAALDKAAANSNMQLTQYNASVR